MLVVVYLSEAKRYTVVPEQFIYRLNERNLKNLGLNRNQSRLIYFSADVFEKLERKEVFETPIPNFNLEISTIYPLPNDLNETCFLGRLIKFEDTFEEAMSRANRLRDQLPAVYNPARVHERPIAPTQLVENEEERTENEHVDDFDGEEEEQVNTSVDMPEECIENAREPQIPPTEHINCDDEVDSTPVEQNESSTTSYISEEGIDSSQIDLKPTHLVDSEDLAAFDHLFDCHSTSSVTNEVDPLASNDLNNSSDANASNTENQMDSSEPQNVSGNSAAFLVENVQNGSVTSVNGSNESANADTLAVVHRDEQRHDDEANEQLVEEDARNEQIAANVLDLYMRGERVVLEDDLEYMYMPGQKLLAIENEPYRMKANDCLCGNRPFKETVRGRAFLVTDESHGSSEEVWLTAHAVSGLVKINKKKPSALSDKLFMKALLIGLCTIQKIKASEVIAEGILDLAKDMFAWRVGADESRLVEFENITASAITDLRNNDFKP